VTIKRTIKVIFPRVSLDLEFTEDQMDQIIRIKDEVNRLKRTNKVMNIAKSFDRLEVYNTTLPNTKEMIELLKLLTKARDVELFPHDDPYARKGLFLIDIDNWYMKVSAT
jgi:hypothetical protein